MKNTLFKKISWFFSHWGGALQLFPISHLVLLLGTGYACSLIFDQNSGSEAVIASLILWFLIATLLALVFRYTQKLSKKQRLQRAIQGVGVLLVALYYVLAQSWQTGFFSESFLFIGILLLAFIGIFAIAPVFLSQQQKVWLEWSNIFVSILLGILAGLVVWGGLSGILASLEELFDVSISYKWYQYFGAFSLILLTGSFALNNYLIHSKIHQNVDEIPHNATRRIFGVYIFFPLAVIYFLIFFAYGIKILITGVWPKGIIIRLGIGYFILGMLSFYLTFPEKKKIFTFLHQFLFMSFLLILLLMIGAIIQRVQQYGLTINRYLVIALLTLIGVVSLFSLIFPQQKLGVLVRSALGIVLLSCYGPISAKNLTLSLQKNRLEQLFAQEQISLPLAENSLQTIGEKGLENIVYPQSYQEGPLEYLIYHYPTKDWQDFLLDSEFSFSHPDLSPRERKNKVFIYLGLPEERVRIPLAERGPYFDFYASNIGELEIQDYQSMHQFNSYESENSWTTSLQYHYKNLQGEEVTENLDLTPYLPKIYEVSWDSSKENHAPFVIELADKKYLISALHGEKNTEGEYQVNHVEGWVLKK